MTPSSIDDYFELAMDLPRRQREKFLRRLDSQEPQVAATLRSLLEHGVSNPDFACRSATEMRNAEPQRLDELHHVAIQVDDITQAVGWYRSRFACSNSLKTRYWAVTSVSVVLSKSSVQGTRVR